MNYAEELEKIRERMIADLQSALKELYEEDWSCPEFSQYSWKNPDDKRGELIVKLLYLLRHGSEREEKVINSSLHIPHNEIRVASGGRIVISYVTLNLLYGVGLTEVRVGQSYFKNLAIFTDLTLRSPAVIAHNIAMEPILTPDGQDLKPNLFPEHDRPEIKYKAIPVRM